MGLPMLKELYHDACSNRLPQSCSSGTRGRVCAEHSQSSKRCIECHPMGETGHPTMVKPLFPIPKDFPLSDNNEITCVSCHNPHYQRYSSRSWLPRTHLRKAADILRRKKQFKTHYLRRNNSKKELCLACHIESCQYSDSIIYLFI